MTNPPTGKPVRRPAGRYGRRRMSFRPHRVLAVVLALLAVSAAVAVAVVTYQRLGRSDVEGELFGYQVIDDETVSVTITVTRSDPSRPVVCIVRARAADGSETGRREVLVPAADTASIQVTTIVKSSKPPMLGAVYGCGADIPGYLHSP